MELERLGKWAFILGVVIAVISGLASGALGTATQGYLILALVVLGLVVGFLNLSEKEFQEFLVAAIALVLVGAPSGNLQTIPVVGVFLAGMVSYVAAFVAPAALVVALKGVYNLSAEPTK